MSSVGLNHVSINAIDLEKSLQFYETLFGMERIATYNFGIRTQYLKYGSQQLHIFVLPEGSPRYQHFALNVTDFHAVYDKASEMGVLDGETFGNSINALPDGSVQMYLRDPGGNLVEVDWPDVTQLDRSRLPELKYLADRIPQTGENLEATLYLDRREAAARE